MAVRSRIPVLLSRRAPGSSGDVFTDGGIAYDYAIAGIPFLSAAGKQNPAERKTAPYKKDQVEQSAEPGEQSIATWWLKSQSSFHLGAGQEFMDTPSVNSDGIRPLRYFSSSGLDPWTPGKVSLLKQTQRVFTLAAPAFLTADQDGSVTRILVASGTTLSRVTETVTGTVPAYVTAAITWGGTGTILGLTTDGAFYYVADASGIYRGSLTGTTAGAGTKVYTFPTGVSSVVMAWVKSRLMLAMNVGGGTPGSFVYELVANPTAPPIALPSGAAGAFSNPKYTHPNPAFVWTAICDGPRGIYTAGYSGSISTLYKFALDTSGAMPTLTAATTVSDMPAGEIIYGLASYLSALIGIMTSNGLRFGAFATADTADIQLGPISVPMTNNTSGAVLSGTDRFVLCGFTHSDGTAGLARTDVSQQLTVRQYSFIPDQRFGYAPDLRAADSSEANVNGSVSGLARTRDGRAVFVVPGSGVYVEHPAQLVPTGTMATSQIRFTTLDPKVFRFVRVRGEATNKTVSDNGNVSVSISEFATDQGQTVGAIQLPLNEDSGDMATNLPAAVTCAVHVTLNRSAVDNTVGPRFIGYQLKALPAQRRQRNIILPLSCFDFEQDATGQQIGGDGTALARLTALERIEERGDIVTLQYLGATADQTLTENVVIEQIEFMQTADPSSRQGWGGIALCTLRTAN